MENIYMNRELSWLKFNERVLEEAENKSVPLCERMTFVSIYQSNLDEFFRVRVGSLQDQMLINTGQQDQYDFRRADQGHIKRGETAEQEKRRCL